MGINFSPFEIGRQALRANQLGLAVTGQNIANVNTPGYSRQQLDVSATPVSGANLRLTGNGVTIDGVRAQRNQFNETRLLTETGITGRLSAQRDALAPIDGAFNETGGGGINAALVSFFGAFRDLEAQPTSLAVRAAVTESGNQLGAAFSSTSQRLSAIRTDADNLLRASVDNVNNLATTVADLNRQIGIAANSGANVSELQDKRSEAIRSLTELTGARVTENQDSSITLTLANGKPLVAGDKTFQLQAVSTPPNGLASLTLDQSPAVIGNGRIKGLLDAIGEVGNELTSLDDLAASIANRVNTVHSAGSDLNGSAGTPFFQAPANGAPITATNLTVSASIKANPRLVVAAAAGAATGDGSSARQIAGLLSDPTSQAGARSGSFSSIYASIAGDAGNAIKTAADALDTQQTILNQTIEQRNAVSGVSLDEEAVNLLRYQKGFEAAARFLKIADEVTQTVISLGQ